MWNLQEIKQLKEIYKYNKKISDISQKFNRSFQSIYYKLINLKLIKKTKRQKNNSKIPLFIKQYSRGLFINQIAKKNKVSFTFVKNSLKNNKISFHKKVINLSKIELAYIAGIIDGEGYIGIYKRKNKNSNYQYQIAISNTNFKLIRWINKKIKFGSVYYLEKKDNRKPQLKYTIHGNEAVLLLKNVLKYLIIKKKQAKIVISLSENKFNGKKVPIIYQRKRINLYKKLRKLNKKGLK